MEIAEVLKQIQDTAVLAAGFRTTPITVPDGAGGAVSIPVALISSGDTQHIRSLASAIVEGAEVAKRLRLESATGPDRREGTANHQALASFIEHANRFKLPDSAVWADAAGRKLVSVIDYHPAGGAPTATRWCKHRGVYPCPLSEAWMAWGGGGGVSLSQDDFAKLLDSRDRELTTGNKSPDPATLITLANNLEVFSHASAKRERDPGTGRVKVSFSEENGVVGQITPPPAFLIQIPVFQDGAPQVLEVRLRVDVKDGEATFTIQIHAAGDVLREAFKSICDQVGAQTSLPVFIGTPEA